MAIPRRPEQYELAPSGETWPGTLEGLLRAMDDVVILSGRQPEEHFRLLAVRDGVGYPVREYMNGKEL